MAVRTSDAQSSPGWGTTTRWVKALAIVNVAGLLVFFLLFFPIEIGAHKPATNKRPEKEDDRLFVTDYNDDVVDVANVAGLALCSEIVASGGSRNLARPYLSTCSRRWRARHPQTPFSLVHSRFLFFFLSLSSVTVVVGVALLVLGACPCEIFALVSGPWSADMRQIINELGVPFWSLLSPPSHRGRARLAHQRIKTKNF
jgi:hypothetical protein